MEAQTYYILAACISSLGALYYLHAMNKAMQEYTIYKRTFAGAYGAAAVGFACLTHFILKYLL